MKKKTIISAILASCMAFSAVGAITANAGFWEQYGYDAYCSRQYRSGRLGYVGYGVADGSRATVISGYMNSSSGKLYASGNRRQKTTPWVDSYASSGDGMFTFFRSETGYYVPIFY